MNHHYLNYILLYKPEATSMWCSAQSSKQQQHLGNKNYLICSKLPFQLIGLDLGAHLGLKLPSEKV